jgi:hypothetical protein
MPFSPSVTDARRTRTSRRRTPRLTAVLLLLATVAGSLATVVSAPPAGAVPVDGRYTGTITNTTSGGSMGSTAPLTVDLSTPDAANRSTVSASVDIGSGAAGSDSGVTVDCFGTRAIPTGTIAFSNGSGGVASAALPGTAAISMMGSTTAAGFNVPISISATVSADRSLVTGTATLSLPLNCGTATLSFTDAFSNKPYALRTGHDGTTDAMTGNDLTHMIDREDVGTPTPWERCMYVWAALPAGDPVPPSATWSVAPGTAAGATLPAGVHIRSGWSGGAPGGLPEDPTADPLRTMVCITDATPVDTTFTVLVVTPTRGLAGRVLLWVGNYVNYPGRAQGDVHNTTFDELHYDFQGVGEYVDAVDGAGKDFAVQSRLETVPGAPVTVTTAVAARVNGDRVGLYLDASGQPEWYLDGKPVAVPTKLPAGGMITNPTADHWRVTWPSGSKGPGSTAGTSMQVSFARWTPKDHLNIDEIVLGPGLRDGLVNGLLGSADRDAANDLTPSTGGSPVSPSIDPALPPYEQPLYRDFGRSWLVDNSGGRLHTLFDYLDPAHPDPASYQNDHFPAERPGVVNRQARTLCQRAGVTAWPQIDFCTYDVEVTGARGIAAYYRDGWLPV